MSITLGTLFLSACGLEKNIVVDIEDGGDIIIETPDAGSADAFEVPRPECDIADGGLPYVDLSDPEQHIEDNYQLLIDNLEFTFQGQEHTAEFDNGDLSISWDQYNMGPPEYARVKIEWDPDVGGAFPPYNSGPIEENRWAFVSQCVEVNGEQFAASIVMYGVDLSSSNFKLDVAYCENKEISCP